jgi:hypothetical protein
VLEEPGPDAFSEHPVSPRTFDLVDRRCVRLPPVCIREEAADHAIGFVEQDTGPSSGRYEPSLIGERRANFKQAHTTHHLRH